jgi:lysyl-tRNA synthetase class 2
MTALRERLLVRQTALDAVRDYFRAEGVVEVTTPLLVPSPGLEPHLDPFAVRGCATGRAAFLPTSPEYAMKKLLAAGSGSIFQLAPAFRDEPPSDQHLPEFTMLEWYRVGLDYCELMADCERLCAAVACAVNGRTTVERNGSTVDLAPPWERLNVRDAFRLHAGVALTFAETEVELRAKAVSAGCTDVTADDSWDDAFFRLFLRHVEPKLGRGRPTLLCDYPARMAALSRISARDPLVCERFEVYAGGLELANAFGELTDPVEQRRRFEADNAERRALGKSELPIDEGLLAALESGLPECSGMALGVDRLLMLLTGARDLRDAAAFGRM